MIWALLLTPTLAASLAFLLTAMLLLIVVAAPAIRAKREEALKD